MKSADEVLDERGYSNWGNKPNASGSWATYLYPKYRLDVGAPVETAKRDGNGWRRRYQRGLDGHYVDENGRTYSGSTVLDGGTAQILLMH